MPNYYTEHPELRFHLNNPMMERICELKERGYRDKDQYDYAPQDYADAMDSYDKVLEITGEITGEVAQADAGFGNIWSLQDCIETLYEFGNEDQHSRFIPRICAGETMSMDLTEPDAGSDLQSVMLKATYDEANQCWRLNGVKRFITNGDANLHLVLARSEEGTHDGRGLSMFIYDKNDGGVDVRRIENKLGIHGSPTCELVYKNAKAELCGDRKLGLIKYVMALMNGARLGIAAQSVGLSQAAYNEALAYAKDRKQFGKAIIEFPAVYDMLATMKAKLDAGRALLYQTSRYVDIYKALDDIAREQAYPRRTSGTEEIRQTGGQLHPAGKRNELGICQPERLRLHPDTRRFGLHDGICLPAHLPRRTYHQHLRRNNPASDRSRYPLRDQRFVCRHAPRVRSHSLRSRIPRLYGAPESHDRKAGSLHRQGERSAKPRAARLHLTPPV